MAPNAPQPLVRRMFALFRDGRVSDRDHRLAVCEFITWRRIDTTNDLSEADIRAVVDTLAYWQHCGELEYRSRRIADQSLTRQHRLDARPATPTPQRQEA